ncbi:hypothetical protein BB559_003447 [Furculomyces boomerangus]|uniref:PhoD-like phosphatase domain-containing protein n=2 Tax=Harpellales TaxID=61421 RepID=A0A2T9YL73_9FUNG|nr:hypothetical protein BB559_003447 [Furculomyces boomerangus]PWA03650.1 hypothetical protein BB558_000193 [Smittium angustum]
MDFPILNKDQVDKEQSYTSEGLTFQGADLIADDSNTQNIPNAYRSSAVQGNVLPENSTNTQGTPPYDSYNYYSYFDDRGCPLRKMRQDDILGPTIMFVNTDLQTAEWVGSVMLLVPGFYTSPVVTFNDGFMQYYGQPTIIGSFEKSIFYRYDIRIPLDINIEKNVKYQINDVPTQYNFTIPSQTGNWRWNFWTCNGWSLNVKDEEKQKLGGNDVLWEDLLEKHKIAPFHVMLGGGDQLYCDLFWKYPVWNDWLDISSHEMRKSAPFTAEMENFIDRFYFLHYILNYFYTSKFTEAMTTIPFSFVIDDHDIFDGWGSYPDYLHNSCVYQGIKKYAFKYWLLFQAHTNHDLSRQHGYFGYQGYSWLKQFGPNTAILGTDTRFERTMEYVISPETTNVTMHKLHNLPVTVKHLQVITGVPVAYPRLTIVEGAFTFLTKSKATKLSIFQKDGAFSSICNAFGEPELLDDLNDHWTADIHLKERNELILRLQEVSKMKSMRVTFVAGDVHCAGAGRFASQHPHIAPENDYRLMPQIISSAIMNVPPPNAVIRMCHYSAKKYEVDRNTNEMMYELFKTDVNGKSPPNNNKKLLGRRNYSSFSEDPLSGSIFANIHVQNENNVGSVSYQITIIPLHCN